MDGFPQIASPGRKLRCRRLRQQLRQFLRQQLRRWWLRRRLRRVWWRLTACPGSQCLSISVLIILTGPNKPDSNNAESFFQYFHVLNVSRPLARWEMGDGRWEFGV